LILKKENLRTIIKFFVIAVLVFIFPKGVQASGFEGKITMVKQSYYDTTYFTYYVSNDRIRIEEYNKSKELQQVYLVNINKEEVFVINPQKKIYTKLNKVPANKNSEHFQVKKTHNSKNIKGVQCYQWRVKNKECNTEISYWVAKQNFDFFEKMVQVLNKTDKSWEYFNKIPNTQGFFPMLYEERTLLRDEKNKTAVLNIEKKKVDSMKFVIPNDYQYFTI
ncbi:MAG TPA: DUF4412 domain-containing protein, partial [Bacteroidales bacterium]